MKQKIGCVVLASGDAKRFGENKLNRKLFGKSLIDHALQCIPKEKFSRVCVVTQYDEILKKANDCGFTGVKNKHPDYGISHSIELGLKETDFCDGVMFMVSDQPLLKKQSVEGLVDCFLENEDFIVSLSYDGVRGNPCIFPSSFYQMLYALSEDNGGSTIIRNHEDKVKFFEACQSDELSDIDTKNDLRRLEKTEV